MQIRLRLVIVIAVATSLMACGGKKGDDETTSDKLAGELSTDEQTPEQEQKVEQAKRQIENWLGDELTHKIKSLGASMGADLGKKLGQDGEVKSATGAMIKGVMNDPTVKPKLDKIADEATSGVANKAVLLWKAMTSGGVDNYKKKVKEETQAAAIPVLTEHIKMNILKDPRASMLFKDFGDALKLPAAISATAIQENLSPKVSKKVRKIAMEVATTGDKDVMASQIGTWVKDCQQETEREVERFFAGVSKLKSFEKSIQGLAVEVLSHDRMKVELSLMTSKLVADKQVYKSLVKIYEAAAFQHGQGEIQAQIRKTLSSSTVNEELFALLDRLVNAEGAGPIMAKHAAVISEDPEFAAHIEDFVMNVLEICGDPMK